MCMASTENKPNDFEEGRGRGRGREKKKVESKKKIGRNKGGKFPRTKKDGRKEGGGEDQFQTICRTISPRFWIRDW